MSLTLKFVRVILIILSLPGIVATLYAGSVATSLIYAEMYPDPNNIAHGMGMLALFPMIAWVLVALTYLFCLWLLWLVAKKVSSSNITLSKKSNIAFIEKSSYQNKNLFLRISPNKAQRHGHYVCWTLASSRRCGRR